MKYGPEVRAVVVKRASCGEKDRDIARSLGIGTETVRRWTRDAGYEYGMSGETP